MNSSSRTPAPGSGSIAERAEPGVAAAVAAVAAAAAVLVVAAVAPVGFAAATAAAAAAAVVASAFLVVAAFVFAVVDGKVAALAEQFFHYCSNFDSAAACSIAFARRRFARSPTSPPPATRARGYSTSSLSVPDFHQLNPTL